MTVPGLIPTRITELPEYAGSSSLGYLPYAVSGILYRVQLEQVVAAINVSPTRTISAGTGLTGGGDLSANRTISVVAGGIGDAQLATTGVTAATYGSATEVAVFAVDAKGRITSASNVPLTVSGYVPTSRQVVAGDGLSGGGTLTANITLNASYSATNPAVPSQTASPGVATTIARSDHIHPAPDISVADQIQGVLPLSRGGTGSALSPAAGAVAYSTSSVIGFTTAGTSGQVLLSGGPGGVPTWSAAPIGAGTVTSVALSGGTTGLTVSGSPITSGGTITLAGTVAVANGGTGSTTAANARTALELGTIATQNANAVSITGGSGAFTGTLRNFGTQASISVLNAAATQNWYYAVDDSDSNVGKLGKGSGPGAGGQVTYVTFHPTSKGTSIGPPMLGVNGGAILEINSTSVFGANDWIFWAAREGGVSTHSRFQHFSDAAIPEIVLSGLAARGTRASPTAVQSGDNLFIWDARGFDGSAVNHSEYAVGWSDGQVSLIAKTTQTWTGTAHGAKLDILVTPNDSVTQAVAVSIDQDKSVTFQGVAKFGVAAAGVTLKQGANGRCGTFTANGTSQVSVSNTAVAITDTIIISLNTVGGTVGAHPVIDTITAATGFTVKGTASDTSVYNYSIIKNVA